MQSDPSLQNLDARAKLAHTFEAITLSRTKEQLDTALQYSELLSSLAIAPWPISVEKSLIFLICRGDHLLALAAVDLSFRSMTRRNPDLSLPQEVENLMLFQRLLSSSFPSDTRAVNNGPAVKELMNSKFIAKLSLSCTILTFLAFL